MFQSDFSKKNYLSIFFSSIFFKNLLINYFSVLFFFFKNWLINFFFRLDFFLKPQYIDFRFMIFGILPRPTLLLCDFVRMSNFFSKPSRNVVHRKILQGCLGQFRLVRRANRKLVLIKVLYGETGSSQTPCNVCTFLCSLDREKDIKSLPYIHLTFSLRGFILYLPMFSAA